MTVEISGYRRNQSSDQLPSLKTDQDSMGPIAGADNGDHDNEASALGMLWGATCLLEIMAK